MPTRTYIISRHLENLLWTHRLKDGKILIYNSGDTNNFIYHHKERRVYKLKFIGKNIYYRLSGKETFGYNPAATLISVPNKGREAGKWLEYLINYYDSYADMNIFLQAYPFDHITFHDIFVITQEYGYFSQGYSYFEINLAMNPEDPYLNNNYKVGSPEQDSIPNKWLLNHRPGYGEDQVEIYKEIYGDEMPVKYNWRIGAQFYITKELLLKNKKSYYEKLRELCLRFEVNSPYCFERSWLTFLINSPAYART